MSNEMEQLVQLFAATLNPDLIQRKLGASSKLLAGHELPCTADAARARFSRFITDRAAEEKLAAAKVQPQCVLTVLQILTQEPVDMAVRQSAAVFFKNLVKAHWSPEDETGDTVPVATKAQVKDGLLSLFLAVPPRLQAQLSEAMSLIASHDFPDQWPNLLGELVGQLGAAASATPRDYAKISGLLKIAHSITGRYRHEFKSDTLYAEIKTVLTAFESPLLELAKIAGSDLPAATAAGKQACITLLDANTLIAKLFYDLTAQDLPEYFEDHLAEWMAHFTALLKYSNSSLDADEDDTEPSPVSCLQAEVVDCLALLMSKEEEAFQPYLSNALGDVWTLLMATGLAPHQDLLVTTSIKFLATVANSVHHALFATGDVLQNVCEKIIAPNVQLLPQDEEVFDDNPIEYVRRDVEGSDTDTRRRVSCDLVRALCRNYESQVTTLFSGYINSLLGQAAASPSMWKAKDAAVYLVIALTIRGTTAKLGATQTNQLVNLMDFYNATVLPELQAATAGGRTAHPILLADALKFVTVFRAQLPADVYAVVMPILATLLTHPKMVVHTYAATAIERLLTTREGVVAGGAAQGPLRFGAPQLTPMLQGLLTGLFGALKLPGSSENAYVMRAILRVTSVAGEGMAPYAPTCIEELKGHLSRVCENPTNPSFNHYMFEAIAALVRSLCATSPQAVDAFEQMLFPPFQYVLQKDVSEFSPYVFQILAQLLECRTSLSQAYSSLFPPILAPTMWERGGNTPALVRLLCAYIAVGKEVVAPRLEGVLGVFQKLLASRATDASACKLLSAIWRGFELQELAQYAPPIFNLCLTRLQSNKKVGPHLVATWTTYIARFGVTAFHQQLESIQPGLLAMLVKGVWIDSIGGIAGVVSRKCAAIGAARLLSECDALHTDAAIFGGLLQALVLMILQDQGIGAATGGASAAAAAEELADSAEIENAGGGGGCVAAYAALSFANAQEEADLYGSETAGGYVVKALAQLHSRSAALLPAVVPPMIAGLPADKQQGVQALLQGVC